MSDYGEDTPDQSNIETIDPTKTIAVAIEDRAEKGLKPKITAAARGLIAEKILDIAFANDIKVRKDSDLAQMLAEFELESPVPTEALMAVAEILSYVYRANGEPNPFNTIIDDIDSNTEEDTL